MPGPEALFRPPQSFWSFTPSEEVRVKGGVRAGLGQKFTG